MSLRCRHALQRRSSCVFRFFRLAAKSACGCFGVLGSTGICYAFRCHVDELPQTIFHNVFLKRRFLKTGVPLVIWTVFFYVFYRTRGTIAWTGWRAFLNSVINFSIVPVYWFFPPAFYGVSFLAGFVIVGTK